MFSSDNNFFEILSIPVSFQVNLSELAAVYRTLQAEVHPDRFARGSEQERLRAIQATSLLNEAYDTLRVPTRRAAYLLSLAGIDVTQVNQADLSPQLLMEQIELREQLEELPRDESALAELESLRTGIETRQLQSQERFGRALETRHLDQARQSYYEMQYFAKLATEIDSLEEDLLGY
ncbi:MAG: Fe-S protein assembly co-chaperone HscB [Gammaproteobacteria bacterium]|nr:Fe-S protein assembly co-chaperone HscB [Pseudomonadales bacterium]